MKDKEEPELYYVPVNYMMIPKKVVRVDGVLCNVYKKESYEHVLRKTDYYARSNQNIKKYVDAGIDPLGKKKCMMCKKERHNAHFPFSLTLKHYICRACSKFDPDSARVLKERIETLIAEKQKL